MKTLAVVLLLLASPGVFAHEDDSGTQPCKRIKEACEKAGYSAKSSTKNLVRDCIKPILDGKTIGVAATAGDVKECKAKKAEHHREHQTN